MYAQQAFVTMEITDFRQGIAEDEQLRIFERFYPSPPVRDQIPGSGLGLSIAHSIVRAHNGDLSVRSQPGCTTFPMSLPVTAQEVA
jgi:signal transduction histidine kinase